MVKIRHSIPNLM